MRCAALHGHLYTITLVGAMIGLSTVTWIACNICGRSGALVTHPSLAYATIAAQTVPAVLGSESRSRPMPAALVPPHTVR